MAAAACRCAAYYPFTQKASTRGPTLRAAVVTVPEGRYSLALPRAPLRVPSGPALAQRTIGPYLAEKRIATGGMAEVFVGKRVGPHGFVKQVALKRILPQLARDPDFVSMFVDEARLAARLSHPNIVQVFDFGESGSDLYIAMELVDGTNVNRLLRACASRKEPVPIDCALHIASETARALAYAHAAADDEGKPLGIVHRDVSPANILLTRTGHVKLSDFGIARAAFTTQHTDEGRLRGKLGYMSPEQVVGKPLDGRSDVFTLATVLAELMLAEPLFGTGTDLDVLLRIRDVDVRTLIGAGKLPADARKLLELGLAREPGARPTATAFADAIDDVIRRRGSTNHGAGRLARLLARFEVVDPAPGDADALEAGARPTTSVIEPLEPVSAETERLLATAARTSPAIYRVKLANGEEIGPMSFPKLVELIMTGQVDSGARISKEEDAFIALNGLPELTRFVTSSALRWSTEELQGAALKGELRGGKLLSIAFHFLIDRETGVLHLNDGKRRKKIYFVEGRPEFIASTDRRELLGEFLVAEGLCLRMEVEMALALLPRYGGRLGDALVGLGIMRPMELFRAISKQVRRRYLEAFRWRMGEWIYVRGVRSHEDTFPLGQDPYELLRDAALELHDDELEANFAAIRERPISIIPSPPAPISAYRLDKTWVRVLDSVGQGATVAKLIARHSTDGSANPDDVYRALFLAQSCDLLRLH